MNNATCETCQRKQGTTNVALDEFYLKNHLGSTVAVMDNGAVSTLKAAYDYRATVVAMRTKQQVAKCCPPFGEQVDLEQKDDKVTELNYFGARYLDPMLGLWVSVDPKRQFASPYLYVGNGINPINSFDPDGNASATVAVSGGKSFGPYQTSASIGLTVNFPPKNARDLLYLTLSTRNGAEMSIARPGGKPICWW